MKYFFAIAMLAFGASAFAADSPGAAGAPAAVPAGIPNLGAAVPPGVPAGMPPLPGLDAAAAGVPPSGAAVPALPPALPETGPATGGVPPLPALPTLGVAADTSTSPGAAAPPGLAALGASLTAALDTSTTDTTSGAGVQAPTSLYTFLYRDDQDMSMVIREKVDYDEALKVKDAEVQKLSAKYAGAQPQGGAVYGPYGQQQQQQGADPRAGGEWDFYFQQLELYDRYVREVVLKGLTEDQLPGEPSYDASDPYTQRNEIKKEFERSAVQFLNQQRDEQADFDDRLQKREDRRRAYYEWLSDQQRDLADWTNVWARKVNGNRWVGGDVAVRLNDWYYGVNFATAQAVALNVGENRFLVSRQPQPDVPKDTLNVLSTNLTPYDLIDRDGNVKSAEVERMKGKAVHEPGSTARRGTIEISD